MMTTQKFNYKLVVRFQVLNDLPTFLAFIRVNSDSLKFAKMTDFPFNLVVFLGADQF